jgi:hypothetical protein
MKNVIPQHASEAESKLGQTQIYSRPPILHNKRAGKDLLADMGSR